ncbi:hypothetical protein RB200_37730 [Streptomyces sp. PmtG]
MGAGVLVCWGLVVLAGLGFVVGAVARRHHGDRRVDAPYEAAARGDGAWLRRRTGDGAQAVNLRNREGNTALHLAYYCGDEDAVDLLTAFGADARLRNHEDLAPPEMAEVERVEGLLWECAARLRPDGAWDDEGAAWKLYDQARDVRPRHYGPALALLLLPLPGVDRRGAFRVAIKLGVPGSEARLEELLHAHGDVGAATDFLNSGSPGLCSAGERWARRHGFRAHLAVGDGRGARWGRF